MATMTPHTTTENWRHDYSEVMSLALDGLLSQDEEQQFDQHLRTCASCQAAWGKWQHIAHALTVEPYAGPPQGFAMRMDRALQRDEQRHERMLAAAVLAGGTLAVLALMVLGAALTTGLWMTVTPGARVQIVETLGFVGQFAALVLQNLTVLRNVVVAVMPDPVVMLVICLTLLTASAIWIRLVFFGNGMRAGSR